MRTKQDPQAQIEFQARDGARATVKYFARYEQISALLDRHPEILAAVHQDLEAPLAALRKLSQPGRPGKFTSETVFRMVLVKLVESLSFRDVVIRIDDSSRLRAFTRLGNDPMRCLSGSCRKAHPVGVGAHRRLGSGRSTAFNRRLREGTRPAGALRSAARRLAGVGFGCAGTSA